MVAGKATPEAMFFGKYHHRLNAKNQLTVPARFRDVIPENDRLNIAAWTDDCLYLFTQSELVRIMDRLHELPEGQDPGVHRLLTSRVTPVDMDGQGRIVIPAEVKKTVGMDVDVVVNGNSERIEIWALDRWQKFETEAEAADERNVDETVGKLFKY